MPGNMMPEGIITVRDSDHLIGLEGAMVTLSGPP